MLSKLILGYFSELSFEKLLERLDQRTLRLSAQIVQDARLRNMDPKGQVDSLHMLSQRA